MASKPRMSPANQASARAKSISAQQARQDSLSNFAKYGSYKPSAAQLAASQKPLKQGFEIPIFSHLVKALKGKK